MKNIKRYISIFVFTILLISSFNNCFALSDELETTEGNVSIYQINDDTIRVSYHDEVSIIKQSVVNGNIKTSSKELNTGKEYYFINNGESIYSSLTGKSIPLSEIFDVNNYDSEYAFNSSIRTLSSDKFIKTHKIRTAAIVSAIGVTAGIVAIIAFLLSSFGIATAIAAFFKTKVRSFLEKKAIVAASALVVMGDYLVFDEYETYRYASKNGKRYKIATSDYRNFRFR